MKRIVFLIGFCTLIIKVFTQNLITFDNNVDLFRITFDTTLPNNKWQIGRPLKGLFNASYSPPRAIVTDTMDPYPANNTSIFYLGTGGDWGTSHPAYHSATLDFYYRMDSDSLLDFGKIEISMNTGQTWLNVTTHGMFQVYDSHGNIKEVSGGSDSIVFTGWTNGWFHFYHQYYDIPWGQIVDTVIYRFTFHSHNVLANKDGWIIDNIHFQDFWESINEQSISCSTYPNPVENSFRIKSEFLIKRIEIYNSLGILLKEIDSYLSSDPIDISRFRPGVYYYRIITENGMTTIGKLIKRD